MTYCTRIMTNNRLPDTNYFLALFLTIKNEKSLQIIILPHIMLKIFFIALMAIYLTSIFIMLSEMFYPQGTEMILG